MFHFTTSLKTTSRLSIVLASFLTAVGSTSFAQNSTRVHTSKSTTTVTTSSQESDDDSANELTADPQHVERDFLVNKTFGSKAQSGMTGCKTEELSAQTVKDLEGECNTWITSQKHALKKKYQTGTCEESCTDCGMSLKRCMVEGVVHYAK